MTLEESRRRKRLQERARRRACQVSVLTFLLLGAIAGLGYIGYVAPPGSVSHTAEEEASVFALSAHFRGRG